MTVSYYFFFFFFQAEDGIRDYKVTGVQTCALPIFTSGRQRQLDVILVWKLDRSGRSLVDVMTTLHARTALGIGFVPLTEALDRTTPAGRAFAGFLAGCAECERDVIRERIKAGMRDARKRGKAHGRPRAKNND